MRFHEALARALREHEIEQVFGVIGDANLFLMHSFEQAGGTYLAMANEAGAVLAANGYAEVSGRIGVATVTHGPGFTNAITALVESAKNRTPLLLLAGDVAVEARDHAQRVDQRELAKSTGAGFEQLRAPATLGEDLATAVRRAWVERRPIVLNVPANFQWVEVTTPVSLRRSPSRPNSRPDEDALNDALGIIASAQRPVIVVGRGIVPEARTSVLRLAERIGAPVATTLRAKDYFRGHPHNLGIMGSLSTPVAVDTLVRSDCIVAFGASLNNRTTADGALLDGKRVVHVDTDPQSINKYAIVDVAVVADAATTCDAMVSMLDHAGLEPKGFASTELAQRLAAHDNSEYSKQTPGGPLNPWTFLERLDADFPEERTLVMDAGRYIYCVWATLHVPEPRAYVHTLNYGSIGLGMGHAVGAWHANPTRPVLLLIGDGGFMLGGVSEFNSAVRHGADLVTVVLNDSAYGAEHIQFRQRDLDPTISTFGWPDFADVAIAMGGEGYTVRGVDDIDGAMKAIANRRQPLLIDVKVDPDMMPAPGRQ